MRVFLETERLLLRRFTESDVANLHDLHGDPEGMRFINGGRPVPRDVIGEETLPQFLRAYERSRGSASGRPSRDRPGNSWGGSSFIRAKTLSPRRSSSATVCADPPGARATLRKGHAH
jgi:hypothetical protein